ncbi:MAG: hypothetical protein PHN75_02175 [Syntrophales bacterium]|nr:hypothetical protein [Syntrophales bacterium]
MKRDVGDLIRTLIRDQEEKREATAPEGQGELTALGVPLVRRHDRHFVIDLTNIRIFRNLHTFAQLLINEVLEQCGFGVADIMVRRKVDPNLTPDLAAAGLDWIMVYARLDAAESLPFYHQHFGNCMQVVFRALQTEKWGGVLFPGYFGPSPDSTGEDPPALLFPFHLHEKEGDERGRYFLVEYSKAGRFLRITMEDAITSRLQLKHIPHRVVDQAVRHSYLTDVYLVAEQIHQGILRECMNNRVEYNEMPAHQDNLFTHLRREGLPDLQTLHFIWPTDDIQMLLIEQRERPEALSESLIMLMKELQLLEDPLVLSCLARGNVIEMISGSFHVYFDVSRYGACLNVSFDEKRTFLSLPDYLAQMPVLCRAAGERREALSGVRLFLVHHITAEVMGLLEAFVQAGCVCLTTFFVKYAGMVPEAYLETLMSLPPEQFRFYGLNKIETRQKLAGRYIFSRQFTPLIGMKEIDEAIFTGGWGFFGAMRLAAGHVFLNEVLIARQSGEQLLLVEDGGYLAPLLNRFCLENRTVGEVFAYFHAVAPPAEEDMPFAPWLEGVFLGGIEHTRNGYDYNLEVMDEFGRLRFPVASIAVSSLKRGPEARECAVAILNALENILHRLGMLLSRRKIIVLGSAGAIGGYLKRELRHRVNSGGLFGVDIAATGEKKAGEIVEVTTLDELGEEVLAETDMFVGVVGRSILKERHIKELILHGRKVLIFVSGSTKTVEFTDLENYLQSLCDDVSPQIGGHPVKVEFSALRDLQTGVLQGNQVKISFPENASKDKVLYLLGELMPINFLYYGIPREIVDEVMTQLFTLSCGLVRRQRSVDKLHPKLLAVDHEIDADANPVSIADIRKFP